MKQRLFFILAVVLLIIPLVFAAPTNINIKTQANKEVQISVLNPSTQDSLQDFLVPIENNTDGNVKVVFTGDAVHININTIVRNVEGKIEIIKNFENYLTGNTISLDLTSTATTTTNTPVNTTPTNSSTTTNTTITENKTVSTTVQNETNVSINSEVKENSTPAQQLGGLTVSPLSVLSKKSYYIIGGVVLVLVIVFLAFKFGPNFTHDDFYYHEPPTRNVKAHMTGDHEGRPIDKELRAAEEKIKAAQQEIDRLKNRDSRVRDAERKYDEARRELERAKRGV